MWASIKCKYIRTAFILEVAVVQFSYARFAIQRIIRKVNESAFNIEITWQNRMRRIWARSYSRLRNKQMYLICNSAKLSFSWVMPEVSPISIINVSFVNIADVYKRQA